MSADDRDRSRDPVDPPTEDELFEGIPPEELPDERAPLPADGLDEGLDPAGDELPPAEDLPELEPEFHQALAEAARLDDPPPPPAETRGETVEYAAAEPPEPPEPPAAEHPLPEAPTPPPPEAKVEAPAADTPAASAPPAPQSPAPPATKTPPEQEPKRPTPPKQPTPQAQAPPKPKRKVVIGDGAGPPAPVAAGQPGVPQRPPEEGDPEPAPRRPRLWLKFIVATLLIVGSTASAVSAAAFLEINDFVDRIKPLPRVDQFLREVEAGEAQNILVLGSDKRASLTGTKGLSDTTILLRLDPQNDAIAVMNIPRDLKTVIPGRGTAKFNEAYALGGPELTLRVVKDLTGLDIHHVVNVDFLGFVRAINAIECVYIDVDRRYFNDNAGLPPAQQYAEIDIQPGYQRLCGKDALEYVRYRHTDTDLVRAARQQDFLREARQRVPLSTLVLPERRGELLDIFARHTSSDLGGSVRAMLDVLDLFVAARNAPIREVNFPAVLHPSFVTASSGDIDKAVSKFTGIQASGGPRGALEADPPKPDADAPRVYTESGIVPEDRKRKRRGPKSTPQKAAPQPEPKIKTPPPENDGLVDASIGSRDVAAQIARKVGKTFPTFYPKRLPSGAIFVETRVYHLRDDEKKTRGAYKMVLQLPQGDYFGVQGIRKWTDPPLLRAPSETRTMRGREFDIHLSGDRVRLVSWEDMGNVYWISNSLLQTLTNDQMLGLARSAAKLPGQRGRRAGKRKQR